MIILIETKKQHEWKFGLWEKGFRKCGFYLCLWWIGISVYFRRSANKALNLALRGKSDWKGDITSN